jgi:pimeloyl-ACP methyl ester carboxylesterase
MRLSIGSRIAGLLLFIAFTALSARAGTPEGTVRIRNVILVHGAWADGSSWSRVIPLLQAKGLNVVAVQLPLTSLADDAAVTHRAIAQAQGPVLLVAHSYGGGVMTEVGDDPKVAGLVYIAASAPDVGQSFADILKPYPPAPALGNASLEPGGFYRLSVKGMIDDVAPDLPTSMATMLAAEQGPLGAAAFSDRLHHAPWRSKPTWYMVAENDRTVPVALERALASRMHATTVSVPSSHMVILSHPTEVAALIESALSSLASR